VVAEPIEQTSASDHKDEASHKLWQLQKTSVPGQDSFLDKFDEVTEFQPVNKKIRDLVDDLINKHKLSARNVTLDVLWKRKGGTGGGRETWGKCIKLSGPAKYYGGGTEFVIWIAADHLEAARITNYQLEALLYHELLHITEVEDEDGNAKAILRSHEFEGFIAEIAEYGSWKSDVKRAANAFKQAPLAPDF
jgi:hypothetical protein